MNRIRNYVNPINPVRKVHPKGADLRDQVKAIKEPKGWIKIDYRVFFLKIYPDIKINKFYIFIRQDKPSRGGES